MHLNNDLVVIAQVGLPHPFRAFGKAARERSREAASDTLNTI
jgi:hypothetical protein